jgi:exopolysaccharide biosynthesis polyprenyl glycosylphosphotransferase
VVSKRKPGALGVADAVAVALSFAGADWLGAVRQQAVFEPLSTEWLARAALIVAAWLGALYVTGAYESRYLRMPGRSVYLTALATALSGATCAGLFYVLPGWRMNRLAFAGFVLVAGLLLTVSRLIRLHWHRRDKTGATIAIGDHELLLTVWRQTAHDSWFPRTLWLVPDDGDRTIELVRLTADHPHEVQMCGVEQAKEMLASDGEIHTVITDGVIRSREAAELLTKASLQGALVADAFSFYELSTGKCPMFQVDGRWLFNATTQTPARVALLCKRLLDLGASVVVSVFAMPVLALAAAAIAIESGFPVLYRQQRMGHCGTCFALFKLRTMPKDAEAETGAIWSPPDDPRATRLGAFLRRTGIDEIPQLWNVLLGQMSLVGPRPERPEIVAQLREQIPLYMQRYAVPPGITGWAQINQGGDTCLHDVLEKLRYDMYYAKNFSLKLDLGILLRTGQMALARAKPGTRPAPRPQYAVEPRNTPGK